MSKNVTQILEWESTDGTRKSILFVVDNELPATDIMKRKLELSEYNSSSEEWETVETINTIDELKSFGIPETLID